MRNESTLRLKFIKNYFANPSIYNQYDEKSGIDIDDIYHYLIPENENKILFYVYNINKQKNLKVFLFNLSLNNSYIMTSLSKK